MNLITNPLPHWLIILLPFIIIGYASAISISRRLFTQRITRNLFSIGIYLASFILITIYSSMIFHSFIMGLTTASLILFIVSIFIQYRIFSGKIEAKSLRTNTEEFSKLTVLAAIISTLVIFYISGHGYFHDEEIANGHKTIIAQLQNDVFPPVNILYPGDPLRYHFGFDLICASLTALTRCSIDTAIDTVTTLSWLFCWMGLALIGRKLFRVRNSEFWVPLVTLFGGGLAVLMGIFHTDQPLGIRLIGVSVSETDYMLNPPLLSYFFQHPFALGLPVVITVLLVFLEKNISFNSKQIFIAFLLLALYFCQTVLFATLLAAVSFYFIIVKKNYRFVFLVFGVVVLAFMSRTGLMFTPTNKNLSQEFAFRFWPDAYSFPAVIMWYVGSVGLLIPFAIAGIFRLENNLRWFFLAIAGMTVCVPIFFYYKYAFDIVKFIAVGNFYLGILSGGAVAWIANLKFKNKRIITFGSLAGLTITGFTYVVYMIYTERVDGKLTEERLGQSFKVCGHLKLNKNYSEAINWCRSMNLEGSLFIDNPDYALSFAVNSGLPTIYNEKFFLARAFATPEENIEAYSKIFQTRSVGFDQLRSFGVRFILHDDKDSFNLASKLNSSFKETARFGSLKLYLVGRGETSLAYNY
jgi:hypothetical protein